MSPNEKLYLVRKKFPTFHYRYWKHLLAKLEHIIVDSSMHITKSVKSVSSENITFTI